MDYFINFARKKEKKTLLSSQWELLTNQILRSSAHDLIKKHRLEGRTRALSADEAAANVWRDLRVSAVIVATPTYAHEPLIRNALESGKHVFCEKPIATTEEAVLNCYQLAEKVGINRGEDKSLQISKVYDSTSFP